MQKVCGIHTIPAYFCVTIVVLGWVYWLIYYRLDLIDCPPSLRDDVVMYLAFLKSIFCWGLMSNWFQISRRGLVSRATGLKAKWLLRRERESVAFAGDVGGGYCWENEWMWSNRTNGTISNVASTESRCLAILPGNTEGRQHFNLKTVWLLWFVLMWMSSPGVQSSVWLFTPNKRHVKCKVLKTCLRNRKKPRLQSKQKRSLRTRHN